MVSTVLLFLAAVPTDAQLVQQLWDSAPDLQPVRARVASARADLERAGFFQNPALDLAANTLPIGSQNPGAPVANPATDVPNFGFTLSEQFELGKRGPRQEAARRALEAVIWDARDQLRQRFWDVRDRLGEIAGAQARIASLTALAQDAARLTALQKARADKGDASSLDADRALLDEEKLKSTLGAELEHLSSEQRGCSEVAGLPCDAFDDYTAAIEFLAAAPDPGEALDERPDLKALEATEQSSLASQTLANRKVIPDPTVRFGYLRDQYLSSGNWQNSLFVGVSIPLPVFDRGQADARQAAAAAEAARRTRERVVETARAQLVRVAEQAKGIEARRAQVRDRALPLARDVVARLDAAVVRGAAGVQDLLIARRTLVELQLDANDLELAAFHIRVAKARLLGRMPSPPEELNP